MLHTLVSSEFIILFAVLSYLSLLYQFVDELVVITLVVATIYIFVEGNVVLAMSLVEKNPLYCEFPSIFFILFFLFFHQKMPTHWINGSLSLLYF